MKAIRIHSVLIFPRRLFTLVNTLSVNLCHIKCNWQNDRGECIKGHRFVSLTFRAGYCDGRVWHEGCSHLNRPLNVLPLYTFARLLSHIHIYNMRVLLYKYIPLIQWNKESETETWGLCMVLYNNFTPINEFIYNGRRALFYLEALMTCFN